MNEGILTHIEDVVAHGGATVVRITRDARGTYRAQHLVAFGTVAVVLGEHARSLPTIRRRIERMIEPNTWVIVLAGAPAGQLGIYCDGRLVEYCAAAEASLRCNQLIGQQLARVRQASLDALIQTADQADAALAQRKAAAVAARQAALAAAELATADELPAAVRDQATADFADAVAQLPTGADQAAGDVTALDAAEARRQHMRALGSKGGQATVRRYGREYMQVIGSIGFWQTVVAHYNGDPARYLAVLHARALAAIDPAPWNRAWENYGQPPRGTDKDGAMYPPVDW